MIQEKILNNVIDRHTKKEGERQGWMEKRDGERMETEKSGRSQILN